MDSGILVSAPAGCGKTVLVNHWVENRSEPCAWVSLDGSGNDPGLFAKYIVEAMSSVVPGGCPETQALLGRTGKPDIQDLADSLIHELESVETRVVLVLDGLECITNADTFLLLGLLLEYSPPPLCVVMCTRRDPPLHLSRLRAQGRLAELRVEDLAFTPLETEALLMKAGGIEVSEEALANLQSRIEGWPVGLRLVISALSGQSDPNEFLLNLETGPRSVERYLDDEVLAPIRSSFRQCLYKTSILDRFDASLWNAVCDFETFEQGEGVHECRDAMSDSIQTQLDQGLFLIPMDTEGNWYRYHPVFLRILRAHLERDHEPEAIATLHDLASRRFESEGLIPEAIQHALSAGDRIGAAEIVERNRFHAFGSARASEIRSWLAQLPEGLIDDRVGLLMARAAVAYKKLEIWKIPLYLELADTLAEVPDASSEQTFFRGVCALFDGDVEGSISIFQKVLNADPVADHWIRIESGYFRALSLQIVDGDGAALRSIREVVERNPKGQQCPHWTRLIGVSVFVRILRGDLIRDDWETAQLARSASEAERAWCDYALGISALRSFDLARAQEYLSRTRPLWDWVRYDAQAALALVYEMQGQSLEADACLARAWEAATWSGQPGQILPLASAQARIALLRGDLDTARRWQRSYREGAALAVRARGAVEVPDITECRVLAESTDGVELRRAADRLEAIWKSMRELHYVCQHMEIAPLRALVLDRLGEKEKALRVLHDSIELAAPEGWIRPYIELGAPMADLLGQLPSEITNHPFVQRIQSILHGSGDAIASKPPTRMGVSAERSLTNREFDVLELLADRLRDKEIADRLGISHDTVKTHLKSLYRKLGSSSRHEAVVKALERNVLPQKGSSPPPPSR